MIVFAQFQFPLNLHSFLNITFDQFKLLIRKNQLFSSQSQSRLKEFFKNELVDTKFAYDNRRRKRLVIKNDENENNANICEQFLSISRKKNVSIVLVFLSTLTNNIVKKFSISFR